MKKTIIGIVAALVILPTIATAGYGGFPKVWDFFALKIQGVDVATVDYALDASTYTINDVIAKVVVGDGTGSGVDADYLDGKTSAEFLPRNGNSIQNNSGGTYVLGFMNATGDDIGDTDQTGGLYIDKNTPTNDIVIGFKSSAVTQALFGYDQVDNTFKVGGGADYGSGVEHEIWHAGNDGSGSGLDADTLDGQEFTATAATTGHATLPGGIILNWGVVTVGASSSQAVTFNQAFGTAGYAVSATISGSDSVGDPPLYSALTTTGMTIKNSNGTSRDISWFAVGK